MNNRYEDRKNTLINILYYTAIFALIYLFFKYAAKLILPLLLSLILSLVLLPVTRKLRNLKIGKRISALILTSAVYLGIGSGLFFLIKGVAEQLTTLALSFMSNPDMLISPVQKFITDFTEKYPQLTNLIDESEITGLFFTRLATLADFIIEKSAGFAVLAPDIIFFLFVLVLSSYYCICYSLSLPSFLRENLPDGNFKKILFIKKHFGVYTKKYLTVSLIMLVITFAELYFSFSLLGISYALLLSVIISFVDLLPVFGVGTVLIPWSIIALIGGDTKRGLWLLIIYVIVTVVREIIEHRFFSRGIGVPPLLTLSAMFCGYMLAGVIGLLLAPFISSLVFAYFKEKYKSDEPPKAI